MSPQLRTAETMINTHRTKGKESNETTRWNTSHAALRLELEEAWLSPFLGDK